MPRQTRLPVHTSSAHVSSSVQASPSSHGELLKGCMHPSGAQRSSVHGSPSSQSASVLQFATVAVIPPVAAAQSQLRPDRANVIGPGNRLRRTEYSWLGLKAGAEPTTAKESATSQDGSNEKQKHGSHWQNGKELRIAKGPVWPVATPGSSGERA